jgi:heme/copper-type cytochrome/quinol oxidase subunit 3
MSARLSPYGVPLANRTAASPGRWAMIWMIATEASLFAYLLFSTFYVASQQRSQWPPTGPLDLALALPNTIILILSSVCYIWAERGLSAGNPRRFTRGLRLAFLFGVLFIVLQGVEWSGMPFTPQSSAFGSLFFTTTGFHGAHVIVGLLMLLAVQVWAAQGKFSADRHLGVTLAGMYWHFVDIVWLFVFTSFYLGPRWLT